MLTISALHPISKTEVLPIVTMTNAYGGTWPDVAARIINPNCQKGKIVTKHDLHR